MPLLAWGCCLQTCSSLGFGYVLALNVTVKGGLLRGAAELHHDEPHFLARSRDDEPGRFADRNPVESGHATRLTQRCRLDQNTEISVLAIPSIPVDSSGRRQVGGAALWRLTATRAAPAGSSPRLFAGPHSLWQARPSTRSLIHCMMMRSFSIGIGNYGEHGDGNALFGWAETARIEGVCADEMCCYMLMSRITLRSILLCRLVFMNGSSSVS